MWGLRLECGIMAGPPSGEMQPGKLHEFVSVRNGEKKPGRGASGFFQRTGGHPLPGAPIAGSPVDLSVPEKGSVRAGLGTQSRSCVPARKRQALVTSLPVQTRTVLLALHPGGPETGRIHSYCAATAVPAGAGGCQGTRRSQSRRPATDAGPALLQ